MSKVKDLNQAMEKYKPGNASNEFFSLENDKDSAAVRFLVGDELVAEKDWFVVHQVEVNGKKRWVQCTEEATCPLCLSGNKPQLKLFIQLVDARDGKVKTWERGQTFIPKLTGLMNKYGPLHLRTFEIQRFGKKGDPKTTYELYPLDKDGKSKVDFPEPQNLLGTFIMQKSHEEMRALLAGEHTEEEAPRRKPSTSGDDFF